MKNITVRSSLGWLLRHAVPAALLFSITTQLFGTARLCARASGWLECVVYILDYYICAFVFLWLDLLASRVVSGVLGKYLTEALQVQRIVTDSVRQT